MSRLSRVYQSQLEGGFSLEEAVLDDLLEISLFVKAVTSLSKTRLNKPSLIAKAYKDYLIEISEVLYEASGKVLTPGLRRFIRKDILSFLRKGSTPML